MDWRLGVQLSEYQHWRNLLDGFILARQHEANYSRYFSPSYSPASILTTPSQPYIPTMPVDPFYTNTRGRSASPPIFSPDHSRVYAIPESVQRKRSAYAAFAGQGPLVYDVPYEPAQKVVHHDNNQQATATRIQQPAPIFNSNVSVVRSSSLNRQIARMPSEAQQMARRGSAGHIHGEVPSFGHEGDLRHGQWVES
jgi:hypothetical protein